MSFNLSTKINNLINLINYYINNAIFNPLTSSLNFNGYNIDGLNILNVNEIQTNTAPEITITSDLNINNNSHLLFSPNSHIKHLNKIENQNTQQLDIYQGNNIRFSMLSNGNILIRKALLLGNQGTTDPGSLILYDANNANTYYNIINNISDGNLNLNPVINNITKSTINLYDISLDAPNFPKLYINSLPSYGFEYEKTFSGGDLIGIYDGVNNLLGSTTGRIKKINNIVYITVDNTAQLTLFNSYFKLKPVNNLTFNNLIIPSQNINLSSVQSLDNIGIGRYNIYPEINTDGYLYLYNNNRTNYASGNYILYSFSLSYLI